jgi:glycosyltransferase involved in cell wall biosynthesis
MADAPLAADPSPHRDAARLLDELWAELAAPALRGEGRPDFRFDPEVYALAHPDLPRDPDALRRHWHRPGQGGERPANRYARARARLPALDAVLAPLITEPRLAGALALGLPGAGELAFELIALGAPVDAAVSHFSHEHYLRSHPDVARAGADPLQHWLSRGRLEGRATLAGLRERHHRGAQAFDPLRPTVLLATHELSRTGAPVVALDLAREAARSMNVVVAALKDGTLLEAFRETSCELLVSPAPEDEVRFIRSEAWDAISLGLINSVEAYGLARLLVARDVPFAVYVHEYPAYSFPLHKTVSVALFPDLLVFSSEQVRDTWRPRLADVEFDVGRDSAVLPQRSAAFRAADPEACRAARGRLSRVLGRDLADARLICGAGTWQWRKGCDLFASAAGIARGLAPDAVFVWIGDGLNREDPHFGVWMGVQLDRAGANRPDGHLFTLPGGPLYPDLLLAADAMFLSSRLDPLPNVAFDALEAGARVVAFEGATGFADPAYAEGGHVVTVEYANPAAAAQALLAVPRKLAPGRTVASAPPPAGPPVFDRIAGLLRARVEERRFHVLFAPGDGRSLLFGDSEADRPLRRREAERVGRLRRRMGWRDEADAREALEESGNWVHAACRIVAPPPDAPEPFPFGLHWHAHYLDDLAADLARPLVAQARRLVLTTDTAGKAEAIRQAAAGLGLHPEVFVVPNRGRDVLPFLDLFAPGGPGGEEAVWAHLHQKRSLGSAAHGDRWRRFLLDALLGPAGGPPSGAARLAQAEGTGLVAAFDLHFVPWYASRALLPQVAAKLPGPLPDNPLLFPVGNMFWARTPVVLAMRELWGEDHPWPNEPIASDGTEFHLIERLWPAVTAAQGLLAVFLSDPSLRGAR